MPQIPVVKPIPRFHHDEEVQAEIDAPIPEVLQQPQPVPRPPGDQRREPRDPE